MQVKKFEAPTMQEALNLVKAELGPEAIILSTKNHRKGFGLLSKASVEVTAAVADKSLAKKQVTEKLVQPQQRESLTKLPATKQAAVYDDFDEYIQKKRQARRGSMPDRSGMDALMGAAPVTPAAQRVTPGGGAFAAAANASQPKGSGKISHPPRYIDIGDDDEESRPEASGYARNGRMAAAAQQAAAHSGGGYGATETVAPAPTQGERFAEMRERMSAPAAPSVDSPDMAALQGELQRLKSMLEELKSEQMTLTDARIPEATSEEVQAEYNNLLRNGVDKRYATPLVKQVAFALPREALAESARIVEALAVEMMENVKIDHPLDFKAGSGQRVFALVGPTGVGKTTTIAKLASQAILQKNLRVGLINIDSYKVAALDQLATYAKILNVPFRQASTALELDRALQDFKPLDLVLIDTSGRSQRDTDSLVQMKQLFAENAAVRPLLIMSATTRDQELYDIITRFRIFNPMGLVFSKLDETATFGCVYNVAVKTALPLTYFTVGQRVPEDIEPASRERVADLILDL